MKNRVNNLSKIVPLDSCWMMESSRFNQAYKVLQAWDGIGFSWDDEDHEPEAPKRKAYSVQDGVALLSLAGPMTKDPHCLQMFFGGTSTRMMRVALRDAVSDSSVKSIVMRIDSGGGMSAGTADLADDIAKLKSKKPIYGYAEDCCASAAYWAGSQCTKMFANRTALVGSIGTYMVVEDSSEAAAEAGYKVHVVKAGDLKGSGVDGTPVTDKQLAEWQRTVNQLNSEFVRSVAKGRNLSQAKAEDLADGRVHIASEAHVLGLIDGVCSLEDCMTQALDCAAQMASAGRTVESSAQENIRMDEEIMQDAQTQGLFAKFLAWAKGQGAQSDAQPEPTTATTTGGTTTVLTASFEGNKPVNFSDSPEYVALQEQIKALTDTVSAQNGLLVAANEKLAKAEAKAEQDAAKARVEKAIEHGFLEPNRRDAFLALAEKSKEAFELSMETIEAGTPVSGFMAAIDAKSLVANATGAGAELTEKAQALAKERGISMGNALRIVSQQNPALAAEYAREQDRIARENAVS